MPHIDWKEYEPALFEIQVRQAAEAGEAVYFRTAHTCVVRDLIIIQPGPEPKTLTVKIPHVLSVIDMKRVELCFSIYREQMREES